MLLGIMVIGVLDVRGDGECVAAEMTSIQLTTWVKIEWEFT